MAGKQAPGWLASSGSLVPWKRCVFLAVVTHRLAIVRNRLTKSQGLPENDVRAAADFAA